MAKFTVKTTFDSSENLIFACLDAQGNHVGVVKTKNEKIMFTNNENKTKHFEEDVKEFMRFMDENSYHLNRPSAEDSRWVEYQPNPKKYKTGDCSIRAYTKAENMSWEDAYDMADAITELKKKMGMACTLSEIGVKSNEEIEKLTEMSMTPLMERNMIPLSYDDIKKMYLSMM